jgi:spore coat polysaccharide biosynthesis predicted glycosyltransferase SpsG
VVANRIVFRADASHAIGFGHVARTAALIEEVVESGGEPVVLFGGDELAVASWARDRNLEVIPQQWTVEQVVRLAEEMRPRAVVIDSPRLAAELAPRLAERGTRTVVVDDGGKLEIAADVVVNHNLHAPSLASTYPQMKRRLLGRRYLMLRREIRRFTRGSCRPMAGARLRVVVTFGGSDPVGATVRTLKLLPEDRPLELVVIAGPGFRDDEPLQSAACVARSLGHTVDIHRAPDDPGALFVSADAAICSAGGTLGELAYLGLPAIAYAIVRDQLAPARELARAGVIAGGGVWQDLDDDALRAELAAFLCDDLARAAVRQKALSTCDGDGPRRVVAEALY